MKGCTRAGDLRGNSTCSLASSSLVHYSISIRFRFTCILVSGVEEHWHIGHASGSSSPPTAYTRTPSASRCRIVVEDRHNQQLKQLHLYRRYRHRHPPGESHAHGHARSQTYNNTRWSYGHGRTRSILCPRQFAPPHVSPLICAQRPHPLSTPSGAHQAAIVPDRRSAHSTDSRRVLRLRQPSHTIE